MRKRAVKIAQAVIEKSFPLLGGKKILILVFWFRFYAFSIWIPPFLRLIVISTRSRGFNDNELTGIIAHELCHQERYLKMKIAEYLRFAFLYIFSRRKRIDEERSTDMLTIEKGYGKELYELTVNTIKDIKHKSIIDNYLNPEEIKSYAIQTGKWYL